MKRFLAALLLAVTTASAQHTATTSEEVFAANFGARNATTITNVIKKLGVRPTKLILDRGDWNIDRDVVVPNNISLYVTEDAGLTGTASVVVWGDGEIPAAVLDSAVSVTFTNSSPYSALIRNGMGLAASDSNLVVAGGNYIGSQGLMFIGQNTNNRAKSFAGLVAKMKDRTTGSEDGELYFVIRDEGTTITPICIEQNGGLLVDPGTPSYQNAGLISAERIASIDRDNEDSRPLALRTLRSTGAASTNQRIGFVMTGYNSQTNELIWSQLYSQLTDKTAGSEDGEIKFLNVRGGVLSDIGPVVCAGGSDVSGTDFAINSLYAYKRHLEPFAVDATLAEDDCAKVIMNNGATNTVEFTMPNIDAAGNGYQFEFKVGYTDLTLGSGYTWLKSGSASLTNTYYLVTTSTNNPTLAEPSNVYNQGEAWTRQLTLAGLGTAKNWAYTNVDTLGFNTIYVRASAGDFDPDDYTSSLFATYPLRVTTFASDQTILLDQFTNATHTVESDGLFGSYLNIHSVDVVDSWTGDQGGTWTKID